MTQEELGALIEPPVDKPTVSRWENAKPGMLNSGVIAAYAEALGRHPMEMYRRPDDPSLDALAANMDKKQLMTAVDVISAMNKPRA